MSRFAWVLRTPVVLSGLAVALCSGSVQAALAPAKGTGEETGGMIWVYFAAFVLGTLGIAFMPSKRKEAE